jgi:hypothetical protein
MPRGEGAGAPLIAPGLASPAIPRRRFARVVVADPPHTTTLDARGAVRSVQAVELVVAADLATPAGLARVEAAYWRHITRATLGVVRVRARGDGGRELLLLSRPLVLMAFSAPRLADGEVSWAIEGGALAARGGGELRVALRVRGPASPGRVRARAQVEVSGYHPSVAAWVARWAYLATQAQVHVLVTHGFLRSLVEA